MMRLSSLVALWLLACSFTTVHLMGDRVLKLAGLPVTDFSVLLELPQLEEVTFSEEQREAIEALGTAPFRVIFE